MKIRTLDSFPVGLTTGVIATLFLCWLLDPRVGPIISGQSAQFVTIGVTLLAAAIAYTGILKQIRHRSELEELRRGMAMEAERAILPLALSRVCEISRRGIQDIVGHIEIHGTLADESMKLELTHIESIKAMIRVSDQPVRVRLQAILRGYQVALASVDWDDLTDPLTKSPEPQCADGHTRISLCYRWALLYALAESLFDFARGAEPVLNEPFPNERVLSAVRFSGVVVDWYTDFEGFLKRAVEREAKKPLAELFIE